MQVRSNWVAEIMKPVLCCCSFMLCRPRMAFLWLASLLGWEKTIMQFALKFGFEILGFLLLLCGGGDMIRSGGRRTKMELGWERLEARVLLEGSHSSPVQR